jgi:adenylylsulfate kinase-like enzyme
MFHKLRKFNRYSIKNYLEIYIKTDIRHIISVGKKKIYKDKKNKIVGKNLKAEFPKKPDIILNNNFRKLPKKLANELFIQIKDKL